MSDEPDQLTLRILAAMDQKLDRVLDDLADIKLRLTSVERPLVALRIDVARQSARMDRVDVRTDRVERRLELTSAAS